ncbi:MAG TPA: molybdopterin molybdenumtransferase MoeA, partial [Actinomycetes bacterium]|nr:molybdopterin molybdenumtransferase MoeA [Actinomycetes bacterium]
MSAETLQEANWHQARLAAYRAGHVRDSVQARLDEALGLVLAAPLRARTDLPAFDTVSMDGWAVAGDPPWTVTAQVLAGQTGSRLLPGEAVGIATGAQLPEGATAVLRREYGLLTGDRLRPSPGNRAVTGGADVRRRGEEAAKSSMLVEPGALVSPTLLGLAAAAGHDTIDVYPAPTVDVVVMGDELLDRGVSGQGRLRDA